MNSKTEATTVTTVAFVGRPNVGKSTLLNALVGTKIAPTTRKPQTTRRVIRGIRTENGCQQIYFDTPGVLRQDNALDQYMHEQIYQALADVEQIVAIVDAKDPILRHKESLAKIRTIAKDSGKNIILAINKIDELKDKAELLQLIAGYHAELGIDEIIPISAIKKDGLDELISAIKKSASVGEFLFNEELFTDASEKEIVAELIREKAMLELKEELPYKLAVTIEHFDESRREAVDKKPLISIEAVIHVERKSQKAIVIGKNGETIKSIGIRARKDIEHLLDCQVMLKMFVRIEPNWTTSLKSLRKLGY
jgi:GTP-binding protein Era